MKISIITITYNSEKTIERTLKSVLNQTYSDYEYIIVDGASKDGTMDIVRKYEPLFEGRMKWKSEPDTGIYNAMNKGIERSSGDIIGIVNSDDWLEADALEKVASVYEKNGRNNNAVYCGWINFHYDNGTNQIMKTSQTQLEARAKKCEMGGIRHPGTFVPKAVYDRIGTFDERIRIMADTDLILRMYHDGVKFCYTESVVSNMSDGGVSNGQLMKACPDYALILRKNNLSGFTYYKLYYTWCLKRFIKAYVPISLLKSYRKVLGR